MDAKGLYRQQSIETASPAQLVSMLFHGAVARVAAAQEWIEDGQPDRANTDLQRAQEIVFELRASLDHERGGEIARNLDALYSFCIERLVEANATKDVALLPAVTSTLEGLCDAWDRMAADQAAAGSAAGGAPLAQGAVGYRTTATDRVAAAG